MCVCLYLSMYVCMYVCMYKYYSVFQGSKVVFKDRKLNFGPAVRKQV